MKFFSHDTAPPRVAKHCGQVTRFLFFCCCTKIQASELLVHSIRLRRINPSEVILRGQHRPALRLVVVMVKKALGRVHEEDS